MSLKAPAPDSAQEAQKDHSGDMNHDVTSMTERLQFLEKDNMRLSGLFQYVLGPRTRIYSY